MGKGMLSKGGGGLTEEDFKHLADKWGMSTEDAKKNTYDLLKREVEGK